ncbi:hypothetical protein B0H11DRAFT_1329536 [Mycena galericulata]|nr:hypothetical protein B0H11DRAFT_1329536 [Mycena galericulata]
MSAPQAIPTAQVAPIIEGYIQGIRPAFPFILISTVFSAILVPLLILFLTGNYRWCAIGASYDRSILSPFKGINGTEDLVYNILYIWMPWLVEAVLLLRVVAIYPRSRQSVVALLAFPVSAKVTRAALNIVFLVQWHRRTFRGGAVNQFNTTQDLNTAVVKAAWILELVDNGYISFLFLWRLAIDGHLLDRSKRRVLENAYSRGQCIRLPTNITFFEPMSASFALKLQSLFWIASTNFVFPLIFGLCQIIILFNGKNILLAASIEMVNEYVAIISTVFATIWSSTASFKDAITHSEAKSSGERGEPIVFHVQETITPSEPSTDAEMKENSDSAKADNWEAPSSSRSSV